MHVKFQGIYLSKQLNWIGTSMRIKLLHTVFSVGSFLWMILLNSLPACIPCTNFANNNAHLPGQIVGKLFSRLLIARLLVGWYQLTDDFPAENFLQGCLSGGAFGLLLARTRALERFSIHHYCFSKKKSV